jgi:hypothetical protein
MARPHSSESESYAGFGVLSESIVAANTCTAVIPAPDGGDEIWVRRVAANITYTGDPTIEFIRADGVRIWQECIPGATGVWGTIDFGEPGLPAGAANEGLSIKASATSLTGAEINVLYRKW